MYSKLPVPVHGNGVSLGLYHTGRGGRVNHALQSFLINDIIYCISSVGKLSILKFRTERAPKTYNDTTAILFNTEKNNYQLK